MNMAVDNDIEGSVFKENVLSLSDCKSAIQSVFSGTSCYDLIQQSAKIVVFETTIPCHMAFYALVEHDTNVAPIWDQERHSLVALMTVSDYIRALRLCNAQNVSMLEFQQKSIAEVMKSTGKFALEHPEFSPLDAEDSIQMMCHYFNRTQYDYVPVVNPDDGSLLSVLGYVDVLHLLNEAAKQHPEYFEVTLGQMGVRVETGAHTAMATSMLRDVLGFGDGDNSIGTGKYIQPAVPILNADGTVLGIYHKTDVAFVSVKAADPESVLANLNSMTMDDVLKLQAKLEAAGERGRLAAGFSVCSPNDTMAAVIGSMMRTRSAIGVVVNDEQKYVGTTSVRAIVSCFFDA